MKVFKTIILVLCFALSSCANRGTTVTPPKSVTITGGRLVDKVISVDTTLSGNIVIRGSLIVKKSANLTILPGSVIAFERVYYDDDDISDSDIVVEGSITAIGTRKNPILFTSNEDEPRAKDWKFIFVNFARESVFRHCIIEYAFSGVQVHFTRATVQDCEFRENFDGVRFSTADIIVKNNSIHDNVNGIRYEERGSPAVITYNEIRNNKVGIFCVIRSDDLSTIKHNNIYENADYNVKLGIEQVKDVTMINNYWGTTDEAAIRAGIFDKAFDEQLGSVLTQPYLIEPEPYVRPQ